MTTCDLCGNKTKRSPCIMCTLEGKGKFIVTLDLSRMPKTMEALRSAAKDEGLSPRDVLGELVQSEFSKREERQNEQ